MLHIGTHNFSKALERSQYYSSDGHYASSFNEVRTSRRCTLLIQNTNGVGAWSLKTSQRLLPLEIARYIGCMIHQCRNYQLTFTTHVVSQCKRTSRFYNEVRQNYHQRSPYYIGEFKHHMYARLAAGCNEHEVVAVYYFHSQHVEIFLEGFSRSSGYGLRVVNAKSLIAVSWVRISSRTKFHTWGSCSANLRKVWAYWGSCGLCMARNFKRYLEFGAVF